MTTALSEHSLDWAIRHLSRYGDNDFFPAAFEFQVFADQWPLLRNSILAIDLDSHMPRPPLVRFAPKPAGGFRVLHRLDPVDSLIYTALVHELYETLAKSAAPESESLIRSLRVEPAADGSFFSTCRNAWQDYLGRVEKLAGDYRVCGPQNTGGYVLAADIQDFVGSIQPRRLVQMLIDSKAVPPARAHALGRFLPAVCTGAGRGLPAGPAATTVLSEFVLSDIDRKITGLTPDFARWGDDLRVFFRTREQADGALSDLSTYLHSVHEMTFVPLKTGIVTVQEFQARHADLLPREARDAGEAEAKLNQFVGQQIHPIQYGWTEAPLPEVSPGIRDLPEFHAAATAYRAHFERAVGGVPDLTTARRIMRKAAAYRIDAILPVVMTNLNKLTPVIRETATYLKAVLDEEHVHAYARELRDLWDSRLNWSAYVNEWLYHVVANPAFNQLDLPKSYSELADIRSKALIALRKRDEDWVRRHEAHLDALDLWDRRAVLYACSVLKPEERANLAGAPRRGIAERAVARHLDPAGATGPGAHGDKAAAPDNYPAYGTKAVAPTPGWLTDRIPELDLLLSEHGAEIMVSIQDSVDSGNCLSGSEQFRKDLLQRLGLPPDTAAVAAAALLADRDDPLTRRAARAAALRCSVARAARIPAAGTLASFWGGSRHD
jgi:hypothetical protein